MFSSFERMVARRYLFSRRREGFISVIAIFSFIGIMLGVATLIVVMSVMNGFRAELLDRILGINSHISIMSHEEGLTDYESLAKRINNIDGVKYAAPVINGQVLSTAGDNHAGALVRALSNDDIKKKELVSGNIIKGTLDNFSGSNVIVGARLANALRITVGDEIRLISPKATQTFIGAMPRIKDYKVTGIFEVGMFEYDSATIFMPIESAHIYFKMKDMVSAVEIYADNPREINELVDRIDRSTGGSYNLMDWQQANSHFINALKTERNVMFLILTLIILVAAFNIISGMVMLVTSKKREIAILRTIGATKSAIMRIFFMCGATIGIFGTFFGFLLGLGFANNIENIRRWLEGITDTDLFSAEIYYLSQLPSEVHNDDVVVTVAIALILTLLATIYPAWKAARISPAQGVKAE